MTGTPTRRRWASRRADPAAQEWAGDTREFDLVKELLVALVVVGVLCVALAGLFSSPDDRPITVARWAKAAPGDPVLTGALSEWSSAPAAVQMEWATAYGDAVAKAPGGDPGAVAPGDYGPVPLLMTRLLGLGQTGALDGLLVSQDRFYATDYTKPLLFLAD